MWTLEEDHAGGGTGGMPLEVTQEDCLVVCLSSLNLIAIKKLQLAEVETHHR